MPRIGPVSLWIASGVLCAAACAINPRFVDERDTPNGGRGSAAGAAGLPPGAVANGGSAALSDCASDCLHDVLNSGPGFSCVFCHGGPPALNKFAGLDLESPNLAERLRDRTAQHLDVRVGAACSPGDKLIDVDQPEASWLLKKVRGQQGSCGDPMPQGGPRLDAHALACLERYVQCVARGSAAAPGDNAVGATGGSSGATGGSPGAAGTSPGLPSVPLIPTDGWIDAGSNELMVQGAVFSYADDTSKLSLTSDFTGDRACISGTAAQVDLMCTPVAPATNCYGVYWGAGIGLNLNQALDPQTMLGREPRPYDASALQGFAFDLSGAAVPSSLRFRLETTLGEFCTPPSRPVRVGANVFTFDDLLQDCWHLGGISAQAAKSGIISLGWQVVTNAATSVPFDYCVSNVRALRP